MAKPELGTKRLCGSCGAKFYDLSKDPIVCPKCGTVFESSRRWRRGRAAGAGAAPRRRVAPQRDRRPRCRRPRRPSWSRSRTPTPRPRAARSRPPRRRGEDDVEIEETLRRRPLHRGAGGRATTTSPTSSAATSRTRRRPESSGGPVMTADGLLAIPARPFPTRADGWGHSSVGRALEWHSRGRRFDSAWLHHSPSLDGFGGRGLRRAVSAEALAKADRISAASHLKGRPS